MRKRVIEFHNFSFKYHSQKNPTLKNIHLNIYEGEKVLIVGPSGSGKSTIGHCINGLIPFSYKGEMTGSLKVMGQETKELNIFALSKMVGTVLQDPDGQFIGLTVGEDIAFALENDCTPQKEMFEIVKDASKMVEMDDYLPASVHHLSGGQKQRVSLAGVMVDKVDILLFDEPLANLDPATGKYAMALIDKIQKETNTTVVIIEHRLEDVLYRHVDRIIVVNDGSIVADMSPDQLLTTNILEETNIREPLYIKAVKYAGCELTEDMHPADFNQFKADLCRKNLLEWFEDSNPKTPSKEGKTILELKNISFSYSPGHETIKDVSFSINKGEMVSIVGKNGAGKSTITKLICGFEKPSSGSILFNGKDITNETIKERSLKIGMVMQNPNHMISKHMIFDEVALGLKVRGVAEAEIKERVDNTLKICGLYPFRNWPISALSFGQKKRVTIASILVLEPDIIILDEPTAGQDFRHYTDIMEFLVQLNRQGVTIMMITHDMHLMLEYTERAIVFAEGRKIADDSAVNVLSDIDIIEQANLKETSLYNLALKTGIPEPRKFVERFIEYDREVRQVGSRDAILY
ncbi:ABC transporter ATP-binding protein [Aeribacillus pallidus]|uniref:ABC transporter ATP-binding protein n=1 Tax=Aeribacillus composti TaxID=1868734 RepID=UPI0028725542|nr:ABC transporter ATP-binding protein [Aeribacillus pallidus]MED0714763.1 ABC transporter ATP-binding protein [Aeribacillus composti]MED0746264.1 ABC transporter ATP-binding protein [Aeribacillus composti]